MTNTHTHTRTSCTTENGTFNWSAMKLQKKKLNEAERNLMWAFHANMLNTQHIRANKQRQTPVYCDASRNIYSTAKQWKVHCDSFYRRLTIFICLHVHIEPNKNDAYEANGNKRFAPVRTQFFHDFSTLPCSWFIVHFLFTSYFFLNLFALMFF